MLARPVQGFALLHGSALLLKLAAMVSAVLAAAFAAPHYNLLIGSLRLSKNAAVTGGDLLTVLEIMLVAYVAVHLLELLWRRRAAPSGTGRFVMDACLALVATSLGACWLFVMTLVPFSPNFFLIVYLVTLALHALWYAGNRALGRVAALDPKELRKPALSPPLIAAAAAIVLPAVLAIGYKKVPNFANAINHTRARLNISTSAGWMLKPIPMSEGLEQPMWILADPRVRDRFYSLSRPGRIYAFDFRGKHELLLDISGEVGTIEAEMGALSFALHPRFGTSGTVEQGLVYVLYTVVDDKGQANRLTRFDLTRPTLAERNRSRLVLVDQRRPFTGHHNGGTVAFGPEGFLYFTLGDYTKNMAQSVTERLGGGVFRIDVDRRGGRDSGPILNQPLEGATANYYIPKNNPWYGRPGALGEFWALGFRNPFRAWVDPMTGDIWLGDVGEDTYEEIDLVRRADNCEWPYREGPRDRRPKLGPLLGIVRGPAYAYRQTSLDRAVIGGFVYRGTRLPSLKGQLIFADNNSSTLLAFDPTRKPAKATPLARADRLGQQGITSVIPSPNGGIWVTILGEKGSPSGSILELVERTALDPTPPAPVARSTPEASAEYKFETVCARCHGSDGRGNPRFTQGLAPRPDFTSTGWQDRTTDTRIREVIEGGGAELGLSRDMPAWRGFLDRDELNAMVKKIRQLGHGTH